MSMIEVPVPAPVRFLQLLEEFTRFQLPGAVRDPVLAALADPDTALDMANQVLLFARHSMGHASFSRLQFVAGKLLYRNGTGMILVHGLTEYAAEDGCVNHQLVVLEGGVPCWVESPPDRGAPSSVVVAGCRGKWYLDGAIHHLYASGSEPCYIVERRGDEQDAFVVTGATEGKHYRWIEHLMVVSGKPLYVGYSMGAVRTTELVWGTDVLASGRWIGRPIPYRDGFLVEIHPQEGEKPAHMIRYFSTSEVYDISTTDYVKTPTVLIRDGNEVVVYAGGNEPFGRYTVMYDNVPMMAGELEYWDTTRLYDGQLFLFSLDDGSGMKTYVNLKPVCDGCCISNSPSFNRHTGVLELRIGRGDVGDKHSFNLYELGILTAPTP